MGWKDKLKRGAVAVSTGGLSEAYRAYDKNKNDDREASNKALVSSGMASGKSMGEKFMSDPDLVRSRQKYKDLAGEFGASQDAINQAASQNVAAMRYKGGKMSPLQAGEMQRKLASDIGGQRFDESRTLAKDIYKMDLDKAKYLGAMTMAGGQMGISQQEPQESMFQSIFGGII
jgi:hypothetical protein